MSQQQTEQLKSLMKLLDTAKALQERKPANDFDLAGWLYEHSSPQSGPRHARAAPSVGGSTHAGSTAGSTPSPQPPSQWKPVINTNPSPEDIVETRKAKKKKVDGRLISQALKMIGEMPVKIAPAAGSGS